MQDAQRLMRPQVVRRFYEAVDVRQDGYEFAVLLDGKPARTPARRALAVAAPRLAEAIAAEWRAQAETIDAATMPLTRLVNAALDGVVREAQPVRQEIQRYAGSDLLCYRAAQPEELVARQAASWDPILDWARETLGLDLVRTDSVMHVEQQRSTLALVGALLAPVPPLRLAALHAITTLTGSAILAIALLKNRLDAEAAWDAAHVDEDWNIEKWGFDADAQARRSQRRSEMLAAARLLELTV